jgi:hypothetical protein
VQHGAKRPRTRSSGRRKQAGAINGNVLGLAGFVGLAVLGYHGSQYDVRQTSYASRDDCQRDWGSGESCPPVQTGHGIAYFGPRYYWDPHRGAPVVVAPDGSERVATSARVGAADSWRGRTAVVGHFSRGGFGGIGRGFSSGHGG